MNLWKFGSKEGEGNETSKDCEKGCFHDLGELVVGGNELHVPDTLYDSLSAATLFSPSSQVRRLKVCPTDKQAARIQEKRTPKRAA